MLCQPATLQPKLERAAPDSTQTRRARAAFAPEFVDFRA
jgi:hypothetical protein